jgi:hypothetical protein
MHAVVFEVTLVDRERAQANLDENLVPATAQAPGIVAGYWIQVGADRGVSVVVFESEDDARAYLDQGDPPPADLVKIERRELGEVVAHT